MNDLCVECKVAPWTYTSPRHLCDKCWAKWWTDGMQFTNEEERQEVLKEVETLQMEG
jgi:hypothetical protein